MVLADFNLNTTLAMSMFAFVTAITPGPNNIMLLHSGARSGFERSMPHMLGISGGFAVMIFLCCMGVASVVLSHPMADGLLKVVGSVYMLWLAFKLWQNGAVPDENALAIQNDANHAKPLTFMQAALFQYVNPKAWLVALSIPAVYLPKTGALWLNALVAVVLCMLIIFASLSVWTRGGQMLHGLMRTPNLSSIANGVIVLMTAYCALSVWI